MSRGPMTVLYLGEAALMVAVPADLLADLVERAREVAEMLDADEQPPEYAEAQLLRAVEAIEELEGS